MTKWYVWCVMALLWLVSADAVEAMERKKSRRTEIKKETLTDYEKLFRGKVCTTTRGEFMTIHRVGEALYVEFPVQLVGREMLIASTISTSTDASLFPNGAKVQTPMHVCFTLRDSSALEMRLLNAQSMTREKSTRMDELMKQNFLHPVSELFKILAYSPDSTAVVVNMSDFFMDGEKRLSPIPPMSEALQITASLNQKLSSVRTVKVFEDNLSIVSELVYKYTLKRNNIQQFRDKWLTIKVTRSILLLPEEKMSPRLSDSRIGTFLTFKRQLSPDGEPLKTVTYANRWRMEPVDEVAYRAGQQVSPRQPIVFYLDTLFPESWKEPIRQGVLRWNKAFEQIGFQDAIQVRDFPRDNPDFDADNLKYSCIRYVPVAVANAMGPSWVDPTTGEILNATVLVYHDIVRMLYAWRFVQTAQVDESVREKQLPQDVLDDALSYVIAHEIGHCLGLMHNMGASASIPVDSLRSPSFTAKYGTTPSIMDYARFNYVAQPQDRGVRLTPPSLGVYDVFAIHWLYTPVYGVTDEMEESRVTEQWLDEKAGDPFYRYGRQQFSGHYDPSAVEEDLGDDPIKAGDYGIANLKYILSHLEEWIEGDEDMTCRTELYNQLLNQYCRYLLNAMYQVGGVYLSDAKESSGIPRVRPVEKDKQRLAVRWILTNLRTSEWLNEESLLRKTPLDIHPSAKVVELVGSVLYSLSSRVALSESLSGDNAYRQSDFFDDLFAGVWHGALVGCPLTPGDKLLQRLSLEIFEEGLKPIGGNRLGFLYPRVLGCEEHGYEFGSGYGWQAPVSTEFINESYAYYLRMMGKVKIMLEQKMDTLPLVDRAHYEAMLFAVQQLLGEHEEKLNEL